MDARYDCPLVFCERSTEHMALGFAGHKEKIRSRGWVDHCFDGGLTWVRNGSRRQTGVLVGVVRVRGVSQHRSGHYSRVAVAALKLLGVEQAAVTGGGVRLQHLPRTKVGITQAV